MPELVITAVGPDRPGLVDELTGALLNAGVNIADSRMINLRGQFALLMLTEAPEDKIATLGNRLDDVRSATGLHIHINAQGQADRTTHAGVPFTVKTYAMDQPGIVHRITHLLHQWAVNIEELQTSLEAGAHTGTPLFTMSMRITVPTNVSIKSLRSALEALCDELNCDVDVDPA